MSSYSGTPSLAKSEALNIIHALGLRNPEEIDLHYIAWENGAAVAEKDLDGFEGRVLSLGARAVITVNGRIREPGKKRFVIAHELGHLKLGHQISQMSLCTASDFTALKQAAPAERDANIFASNLLMPETMVIPLAQKKPSLQLFEEMRVNFQTTLTSTILRYAEYSPHRVAIVLSRDRSIEWSKESESFGYRIERGSAVHPLSYAIEFFKGRSLERDFVDIEAKAWLPERSISAGSFLKELAIPMPDYNSVLSLIWINNSVEEN